MRPFSKETNKIYIVTTRGVFMCRHTEKDGLYGWGTGETMQAAYNNAVRHQNRLKQLAKPIKPKGKLWLRLMDIFKNQLK